MPEPVELLKKWLSDLENKHPAEWGILPDIGLYMDQVQTYIDRQLGLYRRDPADRLLTPAMINNYIKDDLIPRADFKKYTQVHLALLIMISALKQVLSIPNLNQLLSASRDPADVADLYGRFLKVQRESLRESCAQILDKTLEMSGPEAVSPSVPDEAQALRNLALELSIEARTKILIAEKIISMMAVPPAEEPAKKVPPAKPPVKPAPKAGQASAQG